MNDHPHIRNFLTSMTKHGEQKAGEQFAAAHPLAASADENETTAWAREVCTFLNDHYDDETVKAIRMDCNCWSGLTDGEKIREIYEKEQDPYQFAEKTNRLDTGFSLEYDGQCYYLVYPQCYCPYVNQTDEPVPKAWCYCTLGYGKRMFEAISGREVQAELIGSVKQGDACCRIRITLC